MEQSNSCLVRAVDVHSMDKKMICGGRFCWSCSIFYPVMDSFHCIDVKLFESSDTTDFFVAPMLRVQNP